MQTTQIDRRYLQINYKAVALRINLENGTKYIAKQIKYLHKNNTFLCEQITNIVGEYGIWQDLSDQKESAKESVKIEYLEPCFDSLAKAINVMCSTQYNAHLIRKAYFGKISTASKFAVDFANSKIGDNSLWSHLLTTKRKRHYKSKIVND